MQFITSRLFFSLSSCIWFWSCSFCFSRLAFSFIGNRAIQKPSVDFASREKRIKESFNPLLLQFIELFAHIPQVSDRIAHTREVKQQRANVDAIHEQHIVVDGQYELKVRKMRLQELNQ
uniref:Putative secreted protein n=1 Tax=Anopheles marajoara TaxID=58244 RepID=A0A2M4C7Y7_9DIPT